MKKSTFFTLAAAAALFVAPVSKAQVLAYDDTETAEGASVTNGGVTAGTGTARQTTLVADDLTYLPSAEGATLTGFEFSVANLNSAAANLKPEVRFYDSNGAGGGPGTLLFAVNFNAVVVPAGTGGLLAYTLPTAQQFTLPTSGTIWAGVVYVSTTSQTAATVNNFGQELLNPPVIGSSQDQDFVSSTTGTFLTNNPAGTIQTSPYSAGGYVANFGWQLTVPEPSTYAAAAIGALALGTVLLRRNRRLTRL